jgi:hypothetical protein
MRLRILLATIFAAALAQFAQVTREAAITVRVIDGATGRTTPVRVLLQDSTGVRPKARGAVTVSESAIPIPKAAIPVMWGQNDVAQGYALQPDGSFYADGGFEAKVPPGHYSVTLTKGNEYRQLRETLDVAAGASVTREFRMTRWADMPARGWYSSDDHIHLRRSPGEDHAIALWIAAEDVHVGNLLQMGDFWTTYFAQYAFGDRGRYSEAGRILSPGQEEPRTPEIGHTISLGAREFARSQRDYYSFDRLFDQVHGAGGVTGIAHQAMSFHGYRGMALNTLRGKTDFLELVQFCVPEGPLVTGHYYEFLDLGFKLTALAGSDFPWCGQGGAQIGNARFYTYTGGPLTFESWMQGMKAGHTFATTGPLVSLTVNGKLPGDVLEVAPGSKLRIEAEGMAENGAAQVEVIGHGKAIAKGTGKVAAEITVDRGVWIAAKVDAGPGKVAHTTPVYVSVGGRGWRNEARYGELLAKMEAYLKEIEADLANPAPNLDALAVRFRAQMERQVAEARAKLREMGSVR